MRASLRAHFLVLVGLIIALSDFFIKRYALLHASSLQTSSPHSFIDFTFHKNYGAIGNLPVPLIVITILSVIAIILFGYLACKIYKTNPLLAASYFIIVLGALGNLYDRLVHGFTIDYLILFNTSIINLSDVLIFLGIFGILFYTTTTPNTQPNS